MSKKKWCALLCLFVIYLLLGAAIFHHMESIEETKRIEADQLERQEIEALLKTYMRPSAEHMIFHKLSTYCGKTLGRDMSQIPYERKWDFYHSLFFVITVVSTIGYGNLAPTTMFSRIFMIFYALIGIPMNGIVMVTLGAYFGRSFTKLYHRWKSSKMQYDTARLGLISQIILYLVPGFTFFIFLPSVIMTVFEGWDYDVAVYYSFVTLTTIGFGDYVAGVELNPDFNWFYQTAYQIFLLVWVIGGLGYVLMVLNYITQAMRSKKLHEIEQLIANNIKKTPTRIRQELRSLLHEFVVLWVKPVYKEHGTYGPPSLTKRSSSCPDLSLLIAKDEESPNTIRKRALSACTQNGNFIQSDTELDKIDKESTFRPVGALMEQKELLLKVVDALSTYDSDNTLLGYENLPDSEILKSEQRYTSLWSLRGQPKPHERRRAISEIGVSFDHNNLDKEEHTWYGQEANKKWEFFNRNQLHHLRTDEEGKGSNRSFLTRIKHKFLPSAKDNNNSSQDIEHGRPDIYVEGRQQGRTSVISIEQQGNLLERTSIADFIRALSAVTAPEVLFAGQPQRKIGNAGLGTAQQRQRYDSGTLQSGLQVRRSSLVPQSITSSTHAGRRFSLRPVDEHLLAPPPYSPPNANLTCFNRRLSKRLSQCKSFRKDFKE